MTQFSNICGASPVNKQILFFDGHDRHFDERTPTQMQIKNIQPFVLKAGDSIDDQPNVNGPNSKLKSICKIPKSKWMLKYGTTRFQPYHMKIIISNIFSKYERLSHPTSIRSNQKPLKCGTVMKLGLTPTLNDTRLCVITSYFKGK